MKMVFEKPYTFEETVYNDYDLNLENLTGMDLKEAEKMRAAYAGNGEFMAVPATDMTFCLVIAAIASNLPFEFFAGMPADECYAAYNVVSSFLFGKLAKKNNAPQLKSEKSA